MRRESWIIHYPYRRIHWTSGQGLLLSILEGTYQPPKHLVSNMTMFLKLGLTLMKSMTTSVINFWSASIWRSPLHPWCKWSALKIKNGFSNWNFFNAGLHTLYARNSINTFSRALVQHTTMIKCWCPYYTCWFNSWKCQQKQYQWVAVCWQEHWCHHPNKTNQYIWVDCLGYALTAIRLTTFVLIAQTFEWRQYET